MLNQGDELIPASMMTSPPPGLVLRLIDREGPPDAPIDCLEFTASAYTEFFQGQTVFSVYRRDIDAFLGELDAMVAELKGQASIRCGWGTKVCFGIDAYFIGQLGRIAIDLELARSGQADRMLRMQVDFETEPELLSRFASALRAVANNNDSKPAVLSVSGS